MTKEQVLDIVRNSNTNTFKAVVFDNGKEVKKQVRIFIAAGDTPCIYLKGSHRRGTYMYCPEYISLAPVTKEDYLVRVRKFMEKVVRILSKSGMWPNMKRSYELLLTLDDKALQSVLDNYDMRNKLSELFGEEVYLYVDSLLYSSQKGVKAIKFDEYDHEYTNRVKEAIQSKEDYTLRWTKKYDYTLDIRKDSKGNVCGNYSEEYLGCGNGHYYYLIDENHAIFGEDD
jgi:hypothetical protein